MKGSGLAAERALDRATRRLIWLLAAVMLSSFAFGIAMFIPAEHRAEKLEETMQRYQARAPGSGQQQPEPRKRPDW